MMSYVANFAPSDQGTRLGPAVYGEWVLYNDQHFIYTPEIVRGLEGFPRKLYTDEANLKVTPQQKRGHAEREHLPKLRR